MKPSVTAAQHKFENGLLPEQAIQNVNVVQHQICTGAYAIEIAGHMSLPPLVADELVSTVISLTAQDEDGLLAQSVIALWHSLEHEQPAVLLPQPEQPGLAEVIDMFTCKARPTTANTRECLDNTGGQPLQITEAHLRKISQLTTSAVGVKKEYEDEFKRRRYLHVAYAAKRDPSTLEELVKDYESLVLSCVTKLSYASYLKEDLLQVGRIGLLMSLERFNPLAGHSFIGFAIPYIVGNIKNYLRDYGYAIRPPRGVHELYPRVSEAYDTLQQVLCREPTSEEIALYLDVQLHDVLEVQGVGNVRAVLSYDELIQENGDFVAESHHYFNEGDAGTETAAKQRRVMHAVSKLGANAQKIIHLRFYENLTQPEIAAALGITQSGVSRALSRAIARLEENLST